VSKNIAITGFASILLLFSTLLSGQQTQSNQSAQPSSSVYNRMRRLPPQGAAAQNQQQTSQTQQFPSPAQQFPPEQQGAPISGQAPPMRLPSSASPAQQQASAQQNVPTGTPASVPVQSPQSATQAQGPYGLALQPANPPRISYANGELTVVADNSSLTDIVSGIERATGARLEGSQPDTERVFGQFGPGSPRDVLDSLLSGSRYDFILVGAIDDPGGVKTIMLSPHGSSPAGGSVAQNQPMPTRPNIAENPDDDNDEGVATQQPVSEAPQPARTVPSEQSQPPQNGQQQQQQQVKTPEQLLQELQRLRQQQQQQQPPQPTNPR
jgi:hypothetical protein